MQAIQSYLDSTYLKTDYESGSEFLQNFILEAIDHDFKLVMIRPEIVSFARTLVDINNSKTLVGTVIDFPLGNSSLEDKISQANIAIENGADELDFVINYEAFKNGQEALLKEQVLKCTALCLLNKKTIKWIIEIAALSKTEIKNICLLIRDTVIANFENSDYNKVFVKSSTGFYKTKDNLANGATVEGIRLMVKNGSPLLIKASGGVRNLEAVVEMIELGVSRIGTSSALNIVNGKTNNTDY
tara:strand:- start:10285 stop:11013 length:729 start_codon:yes stop_codon:yes gene_type:complete